MTQHQTIVDGDHFDVEAELATLAVRRYAMPPAVIAALRQAGQKATARLLAMVENDEVFEKLSPKDQMALISLTLDRAYGRTEASTVADVNLAKIGDDPAKKSDHAAQLEEIAQREQDSRRLAHQRGQGMTPRRLIESIDRHAAQTKTAAGPYPAAEKGDAGRPSASPAQTRNRPVPPQGQVVELRRVSSAHE